MRLSVLLSVEAMYNSSDNLKSFEQVILLPCYFQGKNSHIIQFFLLTKLLRMNTFEETYRWKKLSELNWAHHRLISTV